MVKKIDFACKNCGLISEGTVCPKCNNQMSKDWQGYVVIIDHNRSEIAKKMGVSIEGRFALRVR
ncbi:MAG: DNA-directed RNA polymerase subunit E [Thermoplasmata archaeon]|nr:DNA-directed RNA polymerase subunit E [Thermoplasmata archaeon]